MALPIGVGAISRDNLTLLVVSLIFNGAGQGLVTPLALNAALSNVREDQVGMGSGMISTMQIIGTSVGVAAVSVLFFSAIHQTCDMASIARAGLYGHALAVATLYNLVAVSVSFIGLVLLTRSR